MSKLPMVTSEEGLHHPSHRGIDVAVATPCLIVQKPLGTRAPCPNSRAEGCHMLTCGSCTGSDLGSPQALGRWCDLPTRKLLHPCGAHPSLCLLLKKSKAKTIRPGVSRDALLLHPCGLTEMIFGSLVAGCSLVLSSKSIPLSCIFDHN